MKAEGKHNKVNTILSFDTNNMKLAQQATLKSIDNMVIAQWSLSNIVNL